MADPGIRSEVLSAQEVRQSLRQIRSRLESFIVATATRFGGLRIPSLLLAKDKTFLSPGSGKMLLTDPLGDFGVFSGGSDSEVLTRDSAQARGVKWAAIPTSAPTDAQYLVLDFNGTLTAERKVTAGTNITIADGGANGNATVNVSPQGTGSGMDSDTVDGRHGPAGNIVGTTDVQTVSNKTLIDPAIIGDDGDTIVDFQDGAGLTRQYLELRNSATIPSIRAAGTNTNIGINMVPKGSGVLQSNSVQVARTTQAYVQPSNPITGDFWYNPG